MILYHKVRYRTMRDISAKAVVVQCFDGSTAILPRSKIQHHSFEDALLVPAWLCQNRGIQHAAQKIWM